MLSSLLIFAWMLFPAPTAHAFETYETHIPGVYTSDIPITVHVDGKYVASDVMPYISDGRTLMPMRAAAEDLGARVDWNGQTQEATIIKDERTLVFKLNQSSYLVNGVAQPLDVPLQMKENRIMLPVRAFGEALGENVFWDHDLRSVRIDTPKADIYSVIPENTPPNIQWAIDKFYVPRDSSDPYVGSYESREVIVGPDSTDTNYTYLFISRLDSEVYQVISFSMDASNIGGIPFVFGSDRRGHLGEGLLSSTWPGESIYFNGPATGIESYGYETHRKSGDRLIHERSYLSIGPWEYAETIEENKEFQPF